MNVGQPGQAEPGGMTASRLSLLPLIDRLSSGVSRPPQQRQIAPTNYIISLLENSESFIELGALKNLSIIFHQVKGHLMMFKSL